MSKKFFVGAMCAIALFCANVSRAGILFDANGAGAGGAAVIDSIDWAPGNGLSVGGSSAISQFIATGGGAGGPGLGTVQTPFALFFQAKMAGASLNGIGTGQAVGNFTVVGGITEIVTAATGVGAGSTVVFDLAPVQTVNYFEIYYDPTPSSDNLAGTGFNNYAANPDSIRVLAGTVTDAVVSTFSAFNPPVPLDGFGVDNYPGLQTLIGAGATTLDIVVNPLFVNPLFFQGQIDSFNFTTQAGVPFTTVDPSASFLTGSTTTALGIAPTLAGAGVGVASIGAINGAAGGGPDFQLFLDGSSRINGTLVPEPASGLVFGLLGLGVLVSRRRK